MKLTIKKQVWPVKIHPTPRSIFLTAPTIFTPNSARLIHIKEY